jgi:hypothetical protein
VPFIDHGLEKAIANPALVFYKLQANAYKFAWALIPLSLPFMWLLFPFSRRFHTYDHFVFVTYSISFMLLLFVVVRLLNLTIFGDVATAFRDALCAVPHVSPASRCLSIVALRSIGSHVAAAVLQPILGHHLHAAAACAGRDGLAP